MQRGSSKLPFLASIRELGARVRDFLQMFFFTLPISLLLFVSFSFISFFSLLSLFSSLGFLARTVEGVAVEVVVIIGVTFGLKGDGA